MAELTADSFAQLEGAARLWVLERLTRDERARLRAAFLRRAAQLFVVIASEKPGRMAKAPTAGHVVRRLHRRLLELSDRPPMRYAPGTLDGELSAVLALDGHVACSGPTVRRALVDLPLPVITLAQVVKHNHPAVSCQSPDVSAPWIP